MLGDDGYFPLEKKMNEYDEAFSVVRLSREGEVAEPEQEKMSFNPHEFYL